MGHEAEELRVAKDGGGHYRSEASDFVYARGGRRDNVRRVEVARKRRGLIQGEGIVRTTRATRLGEEYATWTMIRRATSSGVYGVPVARVMIMSCVCRSGSTISMACLSAVESGSVSNTLTMFSARVIMRSIHVAQNTTS